VKTRFQNVAFEFQLVPLRFGLDNIPDEKPLIFVGNHTMYGIYDMPLMIYELRKRKGITLRGLAHPLHYASAFGVRFCTLNSFDP
jgi:hypothetical protein